MLKAWKEGIIISSLLVLLLLLELLYRLSLVLLYENMSSLFFYSKYCNLMIPLMSNLLYDSILVNLYRLIFLSYSTSDYSPLLSGVRHSGSLLSMKLLLLFSILLLIINNNHHLILSHIRYPHLTLNWGIKC